MYIYIHTIVYTIYIYVEVLVCFFLVWLFWCGYLHVFNRIFLYQVSMDALDQCRIHCFLLLTGVEITALGHEQIAFAVEMLWVRSCFIGSGALEGSRRSKGQKTA